MRNCYFCGSDNYSIARMQCDDCRTTDEAVVRFNLHTRKGRNGYNRSSWVRKSSWNRKRNKASRIGVRRNVKDAGSVKRVPAR